MVNIAEIWVLDEDNEKRKDWAHLRGSNWLNHSSGTLMMRRYTEEVSKMKSLKPQQPLIS